LTSLQRKRRGAGSGTIVLPRALFLMHWVPTHQPEPNFLKTFPPLLFLEQCWAQMAYLVRTHRVIDFMLNLCGNFSLALRKVHLLCWADPRSIGQTGWPWQEDVSYHQQPQ
jgi:hypothetical protein